MSSFDSLFDKGDLFLDNGGQTALNSVGLAGVVSHNHAMNGVLHGGQAAYHGAHAVNDLSNGNYREATSQGVEAAVHAAMMNPVIGTAGELATWGPDALANGINFFGMGEGQQGGPRNNHGRVASLPGQIGNKIADTLGLEDHGSPHAHYAD